jgi:NAD-dependent deacetylase
MNAARTNQPIDYSPRAVRVLTTPTLHSTLTPSMPRSEALQEVQTRICETARLIRGSRYLSAFTGAGISVESGIPPFRGPGGLWSRYDPRMLELDYFLAHPEIAWPVIREIFYDHFGKAKPNGAHLALARLETEGRLKALITQNIDSVQ